MIERVYTTIDKTDWGPGEWQDEPDKIQWEDDATGLPCLASRGPGGHWCGYVGVAPGHPAYELDYGRVYDLFGDYDSDDYLEVHGGLTYSAHCAEGPEESSICHVPEPGEPDNVWWLGFDCAHSGDLSPKHEASSRKRAEESIAAGGSGYPWLPLPGEDAVYRDLVYVRQEVARLARHLASAHDGAASSPVRNASENP